MGNAGLDVVVARGLTALGADLANRESMLEKEAIALHLKGAMSMSLPSPPL